MGEEVMSALLIRCHTDTSFLIYSPVLFPGMLGLTLRLLMTLLQVELTVRLMMSLLLMTGHVVAVSMTFKKELLTVGLTIIGCSSVYVVPCSVLWRFNSIVMVAISAYLQHCY